MFSKIKSCKKLISTKTAPLRNGVLRIMRKNALFLKLSEELGFEDYSLPLNKGEDSRFLVVLVALMCFLAVLAASGAFTLNNMTNRWASGLENKVTIEISSETKDGHLLSHETVKRETDKLHNALKENPLIREITVLTHEDVQDLISPWIGNDLVLEDVPLPGLIALELSRSDSESLEKLREDIQEVSLYATLETHHEWLSDLVHFASTLKTLALFIALVIGGATVTAIVAGMHTRMAIHRKEINLMHSIGASDHYIARQFQRHAMIISWQGALIGTISGIIMTFCVTIISSRSQTALIPHIEIGFSAIMTLFLIPVIAVMIATLTSRITVLRSLAKMP